MTNITGKIYQQTNDDGTENRFPKTVVPAVIGLSQYLQDQFNTLSDLYMPKEGESEKLEEQEIIYRKSEATIKAKTVTIDRIYGKTLVWNQKAPLFSITSGSESSIGWSIENCNSTTSSDGKQIDITFTSANNMRFRLYAPVVSGHKYYCCYSIKISSTLIDVSWATNGEMLPSLYASGTLTADRWTRTEKIITAAASSNMSVTYPSTSTNLNGQTMSVRSYIIIDLTLLYGSEISGMTDAQIITKVGSEFPGYYEQCASKLISNDSGIGSTGFNLLVSQPISFNYFPATLNKSTATHLIPGTYYFRYDASGQNTWRPALRFFNVDGTICSEGDMPFSNYPILGYYNDSMQAIIPGSNGNLTEKTGITISRECYMYFGSYSASEEVTFRNASFNFSDTAKNGQYEVYNKNILKLGLDSFKVISHNIWDEVWEVGGFVGGSLNSKNFISVSPSTNYYFKCPYPNVIFYYDANHNQMSTSGAQNTIFTTPANCAFIKFRMATDYGTTYNNNICVNLSDPGFNGQYEPYGNITITGGLKGIGSVQDYIEGNKYHKKIGTVVLKGTETCGMNTNFNNTGFSIGIGDDSLPNIAINASSGYVVSHGYLVGGQCYGEGACNAGDKTISMWKNRNYNVYLWIVDNSYNSAESMKAWLASEYANETPLTVYYQYNQAEVVYELAEPLTYTFKAGTTEERISPNSDGLSAPFCCDLTYNASETAGVLDALQGLSRKLELIEERLARLEDNE